MFTIPAHKQTNPARAPGQIVNPVTPTERRARGSLGEVIDRIQAQERAEAANRHKVAQLYHATADRLCEGV